MTGPPPRLELGEHAVDLVRPLSSHADGRQLVDPALADAGAPYDRRAATYDRLMRSAAYHRVAWSSSPEAYADFARSAIDGEGLLLDVGCGTLANVAPAYRGRTAPTVLVDRSSAMLELAQVALEDVPMPRRFIVADAYDLPFAAASFDHVLAHGLLHLFDDPAALAAGLLEQVRPGGALHVSILVGATRRGRGYLRLLHRAGEVGPYLRPDQAREALRQLPGGELRSFDRAGCMAFAVVERRA